MNNIKSSRTGKNSDHNWQGWLLIVLMVINALGWGAIAAMDSNGGQLFWLPDWPMWIFVLVMLLLIVGAFGFYHFQSWGWILALLFVLVGVVSLISQLLALLIQFDGFLFLLPAVGVISLPYLFRRCTDFFKSE